MILRALFILLLVVAVGCGDDGGSKETGDGGADEGADGSVPETGGDAGTGTGTDTGQTPEADGGGTGDSEIGGGDTGTEETFIERTPLDAASLAGTWQRGVTTLVLGADGTATRQSTDTEVVPFDAGTWTLDGETLTLRYAVEDEVVNESFLAAIVEGKLYDRVLLRSDAEGGAELDGAWEGAFGERTETAEGALEGETRHTYSIQFQGGGFLNRDEYYEASRFGPLSEAHTGRGTVAVENEVVALTYTEYTNEATGAPVEPPPPEEIGRRVSRHVIFTLGGADPAMDDAYVKAD